MTVVKTKGANTPEPVKVANVCIPSNIGKHYVIAPREEYKLRDRVILIINVGSLVNPIGPASAVFIDMAEHIQSGADIEVVPAVQIEIKYWV